MCLGASGVILTLFSASRTVIRPHLLVEETTTTAVASNIVASDTTKAGRSPPTTDSAIPTLRNRLPLRP
jgi:hypothetical protein